MELSEKIKEALENQQHKIKVRGEISGTNYGEFRATNIKHEPITLTTSVIDLKFSLQGLQSGILPVEIPFRIDNANHFGNNTRFPHEHSGAFTSDPYPINCETFGEVIVRFINGLGGSVGNTDSLI